MHQPHARASTFFFFLSKMADRAGRRYGRERGPRPKDILRRLFAACGQVCQREPAQWHHDGWHRPVWLLAREQHRETRFLAASARFEHNGLVPHSIARRSHGQPATTGWFPVALTSWPLCRLTDFDDKYKPMRCSATAMPARRPRRSTPAFLSLRKRAQPAPGARTFINFMTASATGTGSRPATGVARESGPTLYPWTVFGSGATPAWRPRQRASLLVQDEY